MLQNTKIINRFFGSSVSQSFGSMLVVLSLCGLLYIYLPFIKLALFPTPINRDVNRHGYFIEIPKIMAFAPIVINVDPWNKNEYLGKLREGVAHAKGTSLPEEEDTVFLFAHSSDAPWNLTRYNTAFFLLGRVKIGDEVVIYKDNEKMVFRVFTTQIVSPDEVSFLKDLTTDQLILQTCWPIGTDFKRLLVFAKRII